MLERDLLPSSLMLFLCLFTMLPEPTEGGVMMTRPGRSDKECEKKCKEEPEIDCRYYKWHKSKNTCFLAPHNDPSLTRMKKIDKPEKKDGTKPASSWISQLEARVSVLEKKDEDIRDLKKELTDIRTELAGIKNSRALTHHLIRTHKEQQDKNMEAINDKIEVIKSEAKRLEDAIMTLGELQKSFGKKVTAINEDRKSTSLSMAMLGQSNKDMKTSMRELSALSSTTEQTITQFRKDITELEVRFAGLSSDVMEKATSIETMIGPEVKEIRNSQTTLAQALSLITKKIMTVTPQIPELQRLITVNDGMVSMVTKKVKEFHQEVIQLTGRVGFAESQLRKFMDPASKINQERRHMTTQLREEVQVLATSQKRIQNDVLMEISDRTRLYKELADIKLGKKQLILDVSGLQDAYRKMNKDMHNVIINGAQGDLISKILHRQVEVLKKMKSVKIEQGNMRKSLEEFSTTVQMMEKNSSENNSMLVANQRIDLARVAMKIFQMNTTLRNLTKPNRKLIEMERLQANLTDSLRRMNQTETFFQRKVLTFMSETEVRRSKVNGTSGDKNKTEVAMLKSRVDKMFNILRRIVKSHKQGLENQNKPDEKGSEEKNLNGKRLGPQTKDSNYLGTVKKGQRERDKTKRLKDKLANIHGMLLSLMKEQDKSNPKIPKKRKYDIDISTIQ